MKTTLHGTCHCGACAFPADIDLAAGTSRCNCTYCRKVRNWSVAADPASLAITRGETAIRIYHGASGGVIGHAFCGTCGIRLFSRGHLPELGGDFVNVAVAVLDDADEAELVAAPVRWCDGLHDNWWNPPAETRHL